MPLELKIDTDGQTEAKRIEVVGTDSAFAIETFGKPRRLVLDPNNWVLKKFPLISKCAWPTAADRSLPRKAISLRAY